MVCAGHEYVDGTRGSVIMSRTADVLNMNAVCGIR